MSGRFGKMASDAGARAPYSGAFLDNSHSEEQKGYPKARSQLMGWSDEQLEKERRENLKGSFNQMFGMNAKKMLDVIEAEIAARKG